MCRGGIGVAGGRRSEAWGMGLIQRLFQLFHRLGRGGGRRQGSGGGNGSPPGAGAGAVGTWSPGGIRYGRREGTCCFSFKGLFLFLS